MKTKRLKWSLVLAIGILLLVPVRAQVSIEANSPGSLVPPDFVGWDAATTIPLEIRHDADQPIDIYTEMLRRITVLPDASYTIGTSFTGQAKNGSMLLSSDVDQFYANGAPGPYSLLHLAAADDNAQQASYRPWMDVGLTLTGNADHGYLGQKAEELDYTDMVLHWSDNPGKTIKDRLRFIFTSGYSSVTATGASSLEGLEGMRLYPVDNDKVNVGLGDFFAAQTAVPMTVTEPTERLDLLNGRVRLRDLPTDNEGTGLTKFLVVDDVDPATGEYGVVKWRTLPDPGPGGADCDWSLNTTALKETTAWEASGTNGNCPDARWKVGIGTSWPTYKLHVQCSELDASSSGGLLVDLSTNAGGWRHGITSRVTPATGGAELHYCNGVSSTITNVGSASSMIGKGYGVFGKSTTTTSLNLATSAGVWGESVASAGNVANMYGGYFWGYSNTGATVSNSYGVYALSSLVAGATVTNTYGVRAKAGGGASNYSVWADNPGSGANDWAGYFSGKVNITGDLFHGSTMIFSDATLKTDVDDLGDPSEQLMGLRPRRYRYTGESQSRMRLPETEQIGFIAQEVAETLPQLVASTTIAAEYDSLGNMTAEALDLQAVNYVGMIPLLVAGHQLQEAALEEQRNAIDAVSSLDDEHSQELQELRDAMNDQRVRMDQLEQLLAECCQQSMQGANGLENMSSFEIYNDPEGETKLRVVPNPFETQTTVYYTLERSGRIQLLANSSDGKQLRVLKEANAEAGAYQFEWATEDLAPGMYYVTLLLDGQPITKRAVKITR